jgi:phenylalanyl-tRNA synthetase beta chain
MRVPLSWLNEFVPLPEAATPADVMAELVKVGLEEEGSHGGELRGPIVVGKVLEFIDEPQSNGKTIRWCQVEVSPGDVRGIVCGARNFFVGDKVVVTLPGAMLAGGFEIAARKTYGHTSDGMIASARELGLSDEHDGILRLESLSLDPELGVDAIELLGLGGSAAEVNVTPDRGYCLSIRGIAREYAHAAKVEFKDPADLVAEVSGTGIALSVEDSAPIHSRPGCHGFFLLGVKNVDARAKVPGWMANRLKLAGMRSISIAVDITNYVMLELGQPLHAYDADKLVGGFTVRRAKPKEQLQTLDEKVRELSEEDLLICDDQGPIGIAGVMGGARTEVSETTTSIVLEAAGFDPISIARSARRHKLPSEASRRFERGVDPEIAKLAAARAAALLIELAGAELDGTGADFQLPAKRHPIELPLSYPKELVGVDYSAEQVIEVLREIGCEVEQAGDRVLVTPASWRPDLDHKTDLVEEVARLVGYDQIPSRIPVAPPGRGLTPRQQLRRRALAALTGAGFVEVLNYPFVSDAQNQWFGTETAVRLQNPLQGENPALRTSLLPELLQSAARNLSRGNLNLALVEEGSVFLAPTGPAVTELPLGNIRPDQQLLDRLDASIPQQPRLLSGLVLGSWIPAGVGVSAVEAGYPQAINAVELIARAAGLAIDLQQLEIPGFHPGRAAKVLVSGVEVGVVGEVHPELTAELHLVRRVGAFEVDLDRLFSLAPEVVQAGELRVMPAATQDLSLVVPEELAAADLAKLIQVGAGELLEQITLVDDYRGAGIAEGKKSLTFSLVFRAGDRTLTQAEATAARDAAVALASEKFGAELRA